MPSVMYESQSEPLRQEPEQNKIPVERLQWRNQLTDQQKAELLRSGRVHLPFHTGPARKGMGVDFRPGPDLIVPDARTSRDEFSVLDQGLERAVNWEYLPWPEPRYRSKAVSVRQIHAATLPAVNPVQLESRKTRLESVANNIFEATSCMMSDLDQALADPSTMDEHLYRALSTAKKTLYDLAETGDCDSVIDAVGPKALQSPQQEILGLALETFLGAELQILELGKVPKRVQEQALSNFYELWQIMEDSESLTARGFMDRTRKLWEATDQYAKSLDWQPPVEFADGILGIAGRLWCLGMGTLLFTVNLAALGPAAPFVTSVAQSLGEKLFVEGVPDKLKPAAQMASFFGEVLMALGGLADTVSNATGSTKLPGWPEQQS